MSKVWISAVQPTGLHGFRTGALLLNGLSPGLNVVHAPNATGKSTLGLSIGILFDPTDAGCGPLTTISGTVQTDTETLERVVKRRDPAFPGFAGRAATYRLELPELLQGLSEGERKLLEAYVSRGILATVAATKRGTPVEVKTALAARDDLRKAQRAKAATATIEDELPLLEKRVAEAREARTHAQALALLLKRRRLILEIERDRLTVTTLLSRWPNVDQQKPDAVEVAHRLKKLLETAELELETALGASSHLQPGGNKPERGLTKLDEARLREAESAYDAAIREAQANQAAAEVAKAGALSAREFILNLFPDEAPEALPLPTAADLAALRAAASQAEGAIRADLQAQAYGQLAEKWANRRERNVLEEQSHVLRQWLKSAAVQEISLTPWIGISILSMGLLVSSLLPDQSARLSVALTSIILGLLALKLTLRKKTDERPEIPSDLGDGEWTVDRVADAIRRIETERAESDIFQQLRTLADQPLPTETWREIAAHLRIASADPLLVSPLAHALNSYREKLEEVAKAQAAQDLAERRIHEARQEIASVFDEYRFECPTGSERAGVPSFFRWFEIHEACQTAQNRRDSAAQMLSEHLVSNGIDVQTPDPHDVMALLNLLAERAPVAVEYRELSARISDDERELEREAPPIPLLTLLLGGADPLTAELETIEAQYEAQRELDDEWAARVAQLQSAKDHIRRAETEIELPAKEAAYREALAGVERTYESLIRNSMRRRVQTAIQEKLRRESLPELVQKANKHVAGFTSGRYTLELGTSSAAGLGVLLVYDTIGGRSHPFHELSTGTKVHVVVALRLALIDQQEKHTTLRFPLVADEAMAVSDPEASKAMAQALIEIAKERQVILFTNQPDDLRLIRRSSPDVRVLSISAAEPVEATAEIQEDLPVYRPAPGLRQFDPRIPVGSHAPEAILPSSKRSMLERFPRLLDAGPDWKALIDGLERARKELCEEHPRLDWSDIQDQPWATTSKSEEVHKLLDSTRGSPHRFIDALGGTRLQARHVSQARTWLEECGYLIDAPTEDEIRRTISRSLNGAVEKDILDSAVGVFTKAFSSATPQPALL